MSMNSAHNRLGRAEKDFRIRWDQTRQYWHDENTRKYGQDFIEPLMARIKAARDAMVHLETMLSVLRNDCE